MKRLYRSQYDRKISGICGGLADYFSFDPTMVRILVVILCFITSVVPVVLIYLIATLIIPNEEDVRPSE